MVQRITRLLAVLLVAVAAPPVGATVPTATTPVEQSVQASSNTTVTVTNVVDGDTVDIRFQNGTTDTVRLIGADTPETYSAVSPEEFGLPDTDSAKHWLDSYADNASQWLTDRLEGNTVTIADDTNLSNRGSFGRLLRYVSHNDTSINRELLDRGLARVYESPFSRRTIFETAESQAMSSNTGIWGYDASASNRTYQITISDLVADAPGDEYDNLDNETVSFRNDGSEAIVLQGWELEDGSNHVYVFGSVTLNATATVTVHTGHGTQTTSDRYWGRDAPVWNNGGDRILLRNAVGEVVLNATYDETGQLTYHSDNHTAGVPVIGDDPSTDGSGEFAGDGIHQDVNGDGSVTLADVTSVFTNYNSNAIQNNADLFDYNRDGQITLADVTTLFNQVSA